MGRRIVGGRGPRAQSVAHEWFVTSRIDVVTISRMYRQDNARVDDRGRLIAARPPPPGPRLLRPPPPPR
ncbi:unnamed protein product [Spodoptera exigua]|nr:unnamed protein product [Spodoptera exigua]